MRGSRMAMMGALAAASAGLGLAARGATAAVDDFDYALLPLRNRPDRKRGGHRGKRHLDRPRKRRNMLTVSKRTRRKHRRSGRR